jgi:hypothetical protein
MNTPLNHRSHHPRPSLLLAGLWPSEIARGLCRLALLVIIGLASAVPVRAKDFVPGYLVPSGEHFQELKKSGVADYKELSEGSLLSFIRVEAYERSKVTTRNQQTFFRFCQARYYPVLSGGSTLTAMTVSYVVLDYEGRLDRSGKAYKVIFSTTKGVAPKWSEMPAKEFYKSLPDFAKTQLHLVSGALSAKPGVPVVEFEKTPTEMVVKGVSLLLDFIPAPDMLKDWGGELFSDIVETAIKKGTELGLEELAKKNELRWGVANEASRSAIGDNAEAYKKKGASMWKW